MPATITHWHGGEGGERNYIKLQISVFFVWITMQILDVLTYLAVLEVRGRSVSHCVDNGSHSSHWPLVSHYSGKTETQQTAHCQPAGASRHHLSCLPRRQSTRRHRGQAWPGRPLIGQQWRHVWPSQAVHCPPAQPLQHMQGAVTLAHWPPSPPTGTGETGETGEAGGSGGTCLLHRAQLDTIRQSLLGI